MVHLSFEFFPPATPEAMASLWQSVQKLAPLAPDFVSVTYGAGGSTRTRTHETVKRIIEETDLKPAAHLTCVAASKQDVQEVVHEYYTAGVRHIVALRGDSPAGVGETFTPHPEGYQSSIALIADIKKLYSDIDITVSAYPEKHPESPNWDTEIDFLKRKIDAGATRAITQFFFFNDHFEAYLDKIRAAGITIPVIAGILPITNFQQVQKFAKSTGAIVPYAWAKHFQGLDNDLATRQLVGMMLAANQIEDLKKRGQDHFHFYTMNKADLVYALCHVIGAIPKG